MRARSAVCILTLIVTSAAAQQAKDVVVPAQNIPWQEEAPGQPQRLGLLWGRRAEGAAGTLLRAPAGFVAPGHTHTADYRAVVVEGTWRHWYSADKSDDAPHLEPGSYWTQAANEWHADACVSDTPCVILLINEDPYETIVKSP
jgi:quercetin dioxygenase-like cupin family protein